MKLVPALISRAQVALDLGDGPGASAFLDEAIATIDRSRHSMGDPARVQRSLDAMRDALRRLAMVSVAAGRDEEALRTLDRSRTATASLFGVARSGAIRSEPGK